MTATHCQALEVLLRHRAGLDSRDHRGQTALDQCLEYGHVYGAEALLRAGATATEPVDIESLIRREQEEELLRTARQVRGERRHVDNSYRVV